jgi:cytochrome c peroxidase
MTRIQKAFRAARWPLATTILAFTSLTLAQLAPLDAQRASFYGGNGPDWWAGGQDDILPREDEYNDVSGMVRIVNTTGLIRSKGNPFFEKLGANKRACITCHQPSNGMSVSAAGLQKRWDETNGDDAVFAAVDGANCPDLPQDAKESHSLLLNRGLFRIALPWPPQNPDGSRIKPEFRIEVVKDPTGCNTSPTYGMKSAHPAVSVFRRPRVTGNLKYVVAGRGGLIFMADGRESTLRSQAIDAAISHEEAHKPSEEQLRQIVEFESQIYVAQGSDLLAGLVNEYNGPLALGPDNLAVGQATRMDAPIFWKSFDEWRRPADAPDPGLQFEFRASVARGSDVFFGHRFRISDVSAAVNGMGTCSSCHTANTPSWMDIGTANVKPGKESAQLPLFRITCDSAAAPHPYLGRVIYTQDPGRALISGKCADVGSFVMQQFHGLAARAPYFADGSALTLTDLVDFYEMRFNMGLTPRERQDLINFLRVL